MRLISTLMLLLCAWAAPVHAQKLVEQLSDQMTVNRADKGGTVETLARNSTITLEYENTPGVRERFQIGAAELYWLAPASQDRSAPFGVYAELRGAASVASTRLRVSGEHAVMYPALGEFIWSGPVQLSPSASSAYQKQLFDVSCAQGYLFVNRVNVGQRTRYSPYAFENMLFWCEPGDRVGSSIRYQEP